MRRNSKKIVHFSFRSIHDLSPEIHEAVEGDANRLLLAILMPKNLFQQRFLRLRSELSANNVDGALESLVVEALAKEYELTFDACASRARQCSLITAAELKKKELPGGITL